MLASNKDGVLYIGVTNSLRRRIWQHQNNDIKGFTEKYHVHKLVYYEVYGEIADALSREKRMKEWRREWKIKLIEKDNPSWKDLSEDLI